NAAPREVAMITDAQIHLWEVDRPERPWPQPPRERGNQVTARPGGWSAEQMLAEMDATGGDRAAVIIPTWVGEMNQTGLDAAAKYPGRFGIMGRMDVEAPDRHEQLAGWLKRPGMLGIRMTFRINLYNDWLDDPEFLAPYWGDCERFGIPVMILVGT